VPITGGPTDGKRVLFGVWDVRVKDYRAFIEETKRKWVKPYFAQTEEHPAVEVSWDDAKAFCAWLSKNEGHEYRLPSDHEWSCAVGIGDREDASVFGNGGKIVGVYPWGTQWPPPKGAGNYGSIEGYDDGYRYTSPVGSFVANEFGLYDMGGNVLQWCEDSWKSTSAPRLLALRGGSFSHKDEVGLRSSYRTASYVDRSSTYGFRCVLVVSGG